MESKSQDLPIFVFENLDGPLPKRLIAKLLFDNSNIPEIFFFGYSLPDTVGICWGGIQIDPKGYLWSISIVQAWNLISRFVKQGFVDPIVITVNKGDTTIQEIYNFVPSFDEEKLKSRKKIPNQMSF